MAEEYVLLRSSEEIGKIALNKTVFKSIVDISLHDNEDIVIDKDIPVQIKVVKNKLEIATGITLKYGVNVKTVCENLQKAIYDNIFMMTNIKCKSITIDVLGFKA